MSQRIKITATLILGLVASRAFSENIPQASLTAQQVVERIIDLAFERCGSLAIHNLS